MAQVVAAVKGLTRTLIARLNRALMQLCGAQVVAAIKGLKRTLIAP